MTGTQITPEAGEAGRGDEDVAASLPLLGLDELTGYLDGQGLGAGAIRCRRIGDGQSNLTYLIEREGFRGVLRRGPRPPYPPSAHDMVREARLQQALASAGVRVPTVIAVCADAAVLGVPFYLMECLDGEFLSDGIPQGWDTSAQKRRIGEDIVDALIDLHAVDIGSGPLAGFGRPEGFLERQLRRFGGMWPDVTRRDVPEMTELNRRLRVGLPVSRRRGVVHGDYRLGNIMFDPQGEGVRAILDWELAALGDPLADLGYLTITWTDATDARHVMELTPATADGEIASRADLVERYSRKTGADVEDIAWYQALALFRSAVFCEAIYTRWRAGERPDDQFGPQLAAGIPDLIRRAVDLLPALRSP